MAKVKNLLPVTLLLVATSTSSVSFAQKFFTNGNVVTYRGNKFEMSESKYDTILLNDPITGADVMKVAASPAYPKKLNGQPIYNLDQITDPPKPVGKNPSLYVYVVKKLSKELSQLPDGLYTLPIDDIVINTKGKVVYYKYYSGQRTDIPDKLKKKIDSEIDAVLISAPTMVPGKLNNKPVNVVMPIKDETRTCRVQVEDHKIIHLK